MVLRSSASTLTFEFSISQWIGVEPGLVEEEQRHCIRDAQQLHTLTRMDLDSHTSAKQGVGSQPLQLNAHQFYCYPCFLP